jgi:hypothetical protein
VPFFEVDLRRYYVELNILLNFDIEKDWGKKATDELPQSSDKSCFLMLANRGQDGQGEEEEEEENETEEDGTEERKDSKEYQERTEEVRKKGGSSSEFAQALSSMHLRCNRTVESVSCSSGLSDDRPKRRSAGFGKRDLDPNTDDHDQEIADLSSTDARDLCTIFQEEQASRSTNWPHHSIQYSFHARCLRCAPAMIRAFGHVTRMGEATRLLCPLRNSP